MEANMLMKSTSVRVCVCDTIADNEDRDTNTAYPVGMRTSFQRFHEVGHIHQHKARDW
jgi:hypothetical protein